MSVLGRVRAALGAGARRAGGPARAIRAAAGSTTASADRFCERVAEYKASRDAGSAPPSWPRR